MGGLVYFYKCPLKHPSSFIVPRIKKGDFIFLAPAGPLHYLLNPGLDSSIFKDFIKKDKV